MPEPTLTLLPVPLAPEISLHLLGEPVGLFDVTGGEFRSDEPPPFWAFVWAGGQALARYMLDHPEVVAGKRVHDLATGSGVVAIAAALAGAAEVSVSDVDPAAVAAALRNAAANGVTVTARDAMAQGTDIIPAHSPAHRAGSTPGNSPAHGADSTPGNSPARRADSTPGNSPAHRADSTPGNSPAHRADSTPGNSPARRAETIPGDSPADVVLAGDVFYSPSVAAEMTDRLRKARRDSADVLVGDPGRGYFPERLFRQLTAYVVPVSAALEETDSLPTGIWRMR